MKKLMIAAAAAAMVSGAFAEENKEYNLVTNINLDVTQVVLLKTKAWTYKYVNLHKDNKKFGKTIKDKTLAVDVVFYCAGTNGVWKSFGWNKEGFVSDYCNDDRTAPTFDVFENEAKTKTLAVPQGDWWEIWDGEKLVGAETDVYAKLKDNKVKSMKSLDGYRTYSVKSFKDLAAAQAYADKLFKKAQKKAAKK